MTTGIYNVDFRHQEVWIKIKKCNDHKRRSGQEHLHIWTDKVD